MAGSTPASPIAETGGIAVAPLRTRHESLARAAWRRVRRHRLALVSAGILAVMVLGLVFGTLLWPVAINDIDFSAMQQGPSLAHPLGTDDLGQDLLARMIYGGRISLAVGLAAMLGSVGGGTLGGARGG